MTLKAFNESTGEAVEIGSEITDFRGDHATLILLTRARVPGKSGKVLVEWPASVSGTGEAYQLEYYDRVFDLEVREV